MEAEARLVQGIREWGYVGRWGSREKHCSVWRQSVQGTYVHKYTTQNTFTLIVLWISHSPVLITTWWWPFRAETCSTVDPGRFWRILIHTFAWGQQLFLSLMWCNINMDTVPLTAVYFVHLLLIFITRNSYLLTKYNERIIQTWCVIGIQYHTVLVIAGIFCS